MIKNSSAGEESINALHKLRSAHQEQAQKQQLIHEAEAQMEKLQALRRQKAVLTSYAQSLAQGESPGAEGDDAQLVEGRNVLRDLQGKLATHRVLGPCGVTVLQKEGDSLVVSFTCMWHNITEGFVLSLHATSQGYNKLHATNIPYFIGAQSLCEQSRVEDRDRLMDRLANRLNSYIRRKGELHTAQTEHSDVVSDCRANTAHTFIQLDLVAGRGDTSQGHTGKPQTVSVSLDYPSIEATLPTRVDFGPEGCEVLSEKLPVMEETFLKFLLSVAVEKVGKLLQ